MRNSIRKILSGLALTGVISLAAVQTASAATVTEFVTSGSFSGAFGSNLQQLPEFAPGSYRAQLTDLQFPVEFDFLKMSISTLGTGEIDSVALTGGTVAGEFLFNVLPNSTYFLGVVGVPGIFAPVPGLPQIQIGSYAVSISLVPIPAAALLMSSALAGLVVVARRRRRPDDESTDGALAT